MQRIILLLLLINFHTAAYNQIIRGTVRDQHTDDIINYALVYFSGTSVGTESNQNGWFEIDISKHISMPLTISAFGYYSTTLTDFSSDKEQIIYLIPKVFEIKEVVVAAKAKPMIRRINLILFRDAFLGKTTNAQNCKIKNENDIRLIRGPDDDTLKALSSKPILIDNKSLGYKITYYLDKFELYTKAKTFNFVGNIIIKEDLTIKEIQKQRCEERREDTYLGSRMQFFRALWANNLDPTGFIVKDSAGNKLNYYNLVYQTDNLAFGVHKKYLINVGHIYITYLPKDDASDIIFLKENIEFDKNGYFDPLGITWGGKMAEMRIGDWLPYEYSVK